MSILQDRNVAWYRSLPKLPTTLREMQQLPEYSATNPTGVIIGKTWRRHNGAHDIRWRSRGGIPFWVIVRYEEDPTDGDMALIVTYRPAIRVRAESVFITVDNWRRQYA